MEGPASAPNPALPVAIEEIERRYLVSKLLPVSSFGKVVLYTQGYLHCGDDLVKTAVSRDQEYFIIGLASPSWTFSFRIPIAQLSERQRLSFDQFVGVDIAGPNFEVRIREAREASGTRRLFTIKGRGDRVRPEAEALIDEKSFCYLQDIASHRSLQKYLGLVDGESGRVMEVSIYLGNLRGHVAAEVEFPSEALADSFQGPSWLGTEVTERKDLKNQSLAVFGLPETLVLHQVSDAYLAELAARV